MNCCKGNRGRGHTVLKSHDWFFEALGTRELICGAPGGLGRGRLGSGWLWSGQLWGGWLWGGRFGSGRLGGDGRLGILYRRRSARLEI